MRKKRRRWPFIVGFIVLCLGGLGTWGYLKAPAYVKARIEERYPGVRVGSVTLHWFEMRATLHDVEVDRAKIQASFPTVEVDRAKTVWIPGGQVTVLVDESQGESEETSTPSGATVTAENLEVTVRWREVVAELHSTRVGSPTFSALNTFVSIMIC